MQCLDRASVPAVERQGPVTAGLAIRDAIELLASLLSLVAPELAPVDARELPYLSRHLDDLGFRSPLDRSHTAVPAPRIA